MCQLATCRFSESGAGLHCPCHTDRFPIVNITINIWYLVSLCFGYVGRAHFPNLKLNVAMKHAVANTSRGEVIHFGVKIFKIHLETFCDLFVSVSIWRHTWWQSFYQPESWRRGHAMRQRPLWVHTGHAAWARNKPLLFKAPRRGRLFVTATKPSLSWLIKLGPGAWNNILEQPSLETWL